MQVFITGDRSQYSVGLIGFVAIELLRAAGRQDTVLTGDNPGVEAIVRRLADDSGFPVTVVESPRDSDNPQYVDWDARHERLKETDARVIVIHGQPESSRIGRSVERTFGDAGQDRVTFVSLIDLISESEEV